MTKMTMPRSHFISLQQLVWKKPSDPVGGSDSKLQTARIGITDFRWTLIPIPYYALPV
jgi:hypothetical protein